MKSTEEYPIVPRDFVTSPIFASAKQADGRSLYVGDKKYTIGGFKPISEDRPACPALDIRHGRALFTILSFLPPDSEEGPIVRFSINEFCLRYAGSNGGAYARDIKALLADLERCWFKIEYPDGKISQYRILKNIAVHARPHRRKALDGSGSQHEMWLDEVELHPEFHALLRDYMNVVQIDLKALTKMRSPLAQAIYSFMPSRALHRNQDNPFEISMVKLLEQVGHSVPQYKSVRYKIFFQNTNSVIDQINRAKVANSVLRVEVGELADGSDYKLKFWVDGPDGVAKKAQKPRKLGILDSIWVNTGQPLSMLNEKCKRTPELNDYQLTTMKLAEIEVEGNQRFFQKALAILREDKFNELISDAKNALLEDRPIKKTPTRRLIYYMTKEIEHKIGAK